MLGEDKMMYLHLHQLSVNSFYLLLFLSLLLLSRSVKSDSLRPHGPQHARLPCASPSPRACSNSRPSSRWCHPTIPSSVIPFCSRPQSFPASGSFPVSWLFTSDGLVWGPPAAVGQGWVPGRLAAWYQLTGGQPPALMGWGRHLSAPVSL